MRIAVMQPTYLPWPGYFDLMDQCDVFVFLDSVQFEKRSWQQRNRIKGTAGLQLLTIPVASKGKFEQRITDVVLADSAFVEQHLATVMHCYSRAPHFGAYFPGFAEALRMAANGGLLAELTIGMIDWLAEILGVQVRRFKSSQLRAEGKRSELLSAICRELGATSYLSPAGAAEYLAKEENAFKANGIEVFIQRYAPPAYPQLHPPFAPYASSLDVLFNCGSESLEVVRSGRSSAIALSEWTYDTVHAS